MNKTVLGVILTVVAIMVVGGVVLVANNNDGEPATTTSEQSNGEEHTDHSSTQQSNTDTSANTGTDTTTPAAEAVSVNIKDYAYTPATTKIKKGTKVTWTNQDSVRHNVDPDNDSSVFKESELLDKGESYSVTFNTVGTYTYHCSPHPYMKGTVEVTE